jgi:sec-independent protein translocase protein TatA
MVRRTGSEFPRIGSLGFSQPSGVTSALPGSQPVQYSYRTGAASMGGMEILIVLAIILLFFGAKRLPELGRSLGRGIREFRQGTAEAGNDAARIKCGRATATGRRPP